MEQRLSLITLGAADLQRSRAFYTGGLGWTEAPPSNDSVVFYQLGGIVLGLYGRLALAQDAGVSAEGSGFRGTALAYNTQSRADVDAVLAEVVRIGGTLIKPAEDVFWGGYSGYFADPDGHLWEVAWNPFATLDDAGNFFISAE